MARSVILRILAYCGMVCPLHSNSLGFFGKFGANGKIRHLGQYHCVHMAFGHEGYKSSGSGTLVGMSR